jgi:hypothetical protein
MNIRSRHILILCVATILALLPFSGKAFHIDDPLFLWVARHIQSHPADPYAVEVNWDYIEKRIADVTKNPPLNSYFIALAAKVVGWGETALHLVFMIPAIGVVLGTYFLGRRLCGVPLAAALGALLTPVFIVSSTNIMCDTMMLALWVWAVVLWMRGIERANHAALLASSLLIAASAMTKYYGAVLIPLLLAYSLFRKRRAGLWLLYLLIPILVLVWYQWMTASLYGKGLLLDAGGYASDWRAARKDSLINFTLAGLAFTGGCLAIIFFYAPLLWRPRYLAAGAIVFLIGLGLIPRLEVIALSPLNYASGGVKWALVAQFAILAVGGLGVIALALSDFLRCRDADSFLLSAWIMGTFIFAAFLNWVVNGRSVLPMAPAAAILIMRGIERRADVIHGKIQRRVLLSLIPAAIIALLVARADCSQANTARDMALKITSEYKTPNKTLFFQGHWGFQYYMQEEGAKVFDARTFQANRGERIAISENNDCPFPMLPHITLNLIGTIESPSKWTFKTMNRYIGAGFYSHEWGILPFAVGLTTHERYLVFEITGVNEGFNPLHPIGKAAQAAAEYNKKVLRQLYYVKGYKQLGNIFNESGRYAEAIFSYTQALDIAPFDERAYNNRGYAYSQLGKHKEAVTDYIQALRLNPAYEKARENLEKALKKDNSAPR